MFYTEEKLKQRIADLYRLRYREAQPIKSFAFLEDKEGAVGRAHPLSMRAGARSHSETAGRDGISTPGWQQKLMSQPIGRTEKSFSASTLAELAAATTRALSLCFI